MGGTKLARNDHNPEDSGPVQGDVMTIRLIGTMLFGILLAYTTVAIAQQVPKIYRIGTLENTAPPGRPELWSAFREALKEFGYVEGKNLILEQRWGEGNRNRLQLLADELVRLPVDVIVTAATGPALAAKQATTTIPIVMASQSDPVGTGLVASLARPGGNITGLSSLNVELGGKRLELLKEVFPKISRVAVLRSGDLSLQGAEIEKTAHALGLKFDSIYTGDGLENAFDAIAKQQFDAITLLGSPALFVMRKQIVVSVAKTRLPAIFPQSEYVDAGGLMSYSTLTADLFRRAATYVHRILKGANPAELPVEEPTKFEFIINLKTAEQMGLAIPPSVLARADRVIK
jgi:putative ABC transport system substrate-binding protein